MSIQPVEIRCAVLDHPEAGVLRVTLRAGIELDKTAVQDIADAARTIVGDRPYTVLIDLRRIRSMNREARQHVVRPETVKQIMAVALLIESPVSRVIGNLFLGLNRAPYPTRLFTAETDAFDWLRERRAVR